MRILFPSLILLSTTLYSNAQTGWAWMSGFNGANGSAVYGTQGVPDADNTPASMYEPAEWTDNDGNFWMFGGMISTLNPMNAFWKFSPATVEWTWMGGSQSCCVNGVYGTQGIPDPANLPGARKWAAATWTDSSGNLWMFGGYGYDAFGNVGELNDLWKYDISSNTWTWMRGDDAIDSPGSFGTKGVASSSNDPSARHELAGRWVDDENNLWLYGGVRSGFLDDMWKYDIAANQWTWMQGTNLFDQPPVYGIKGVPSVSNSPGGRATYNKWKDSSGNFWFFGGSQYLNFNDLWRFNPVTLEYTWMSGTNIFDDDGNYTSYCDADTLNLPKSRFEHRASCVDPSQRLWLFGGSAEGVTQSVNDLWYYQTGTAEWTWVSGSQGGNPGGVYGTQGTPDPANHPGGRAGSVGWIDHDCAFWMFGGTRFNAPAYYNDLWKFIPDSGCGVCTPNSILSFSSSATAVCEKFCVDYYDSSNNNATGWQWIFPGGVPSSASAQNPSGICYDIPGSYDVTLITTSASGTDTLTIQNYITVYPTPPFPVITQSGYTITSSPADFYQWQLNAVDIPGATNQSYTITQSGYYTVVITDIHGCKNSSGIDVLISGIDPIKNVELRIIPNPSNGKFTIEWDHFLPSGMSFLSIKNALGQQVFLSELPQITNGFKSEIQISDVSPGIYFIDLNSKEAYYKNMIIIID